MATQMRQLTLDQTLGLVELLHRRDHREHQLEVTAAAGAQQRADLAAQQARTVEPEPDRAPAERRILFFLVSHIRQHLVAADVERPECHGLVAGSIEYRAIERELLGGA